MREGNVFILSVCLSVWAIAFESLGIGTSCLVWWYILTISRSCLCVKVVLEKMGFLAHLVYQPKNLTQSCFVRRASSLASFVHTSHRIKHTNFIFRTHLYLCPPHMHIKYLVILTCSFYMAAILVLFFNLLSCPYRQS